MTKYVLASASPRRAELLKQAGIWEFEICPANADESIPAGIAPGEAVRLLAERKALAVRRGGDTVVIAADTVVEQDGRIFGKPRDRAEAEEMLNALSGRTHRVFTGLALARGRELVSDYVCTLVSFAPLRPGEIRGYLDSGEYCDKAGAYGIQGLGALLVAGIDGDYSNVVGLPLRLLSELLGQLCVFLLEPSEKTEKE